MMKYLFDMFKLNFMNNFQENEYEEDEAILDNMSCPEFHLPTPSSILSKEIRNTLMEERVLMPNTNPYTSKEDSDKKSNLLI